jgi:WXG100 family type VII secretion target
MAQATTQVQDAVDQLRSQLSTLQGQAESLQGSWKGDAATAFNTAFTAFAGDYQKVITALQNIQEALTVNTKNYSATETANTSLSTKVSSGLNF